MARQNILFFLVLWLTTLCQTRGIFPFTYLLVCNVGTSLVASTVRIEKGACALQVVRIDHLLAVNQAACSLVRIPHWGQQLLSVLYLPLDILHIMQDRWQLLSINAFVVSWIEHTLPDGPHHTLTLSAMRHTTVL